jgi:Arc/MetJ-type ribon-helix-helix transcriptional regulator
MVFMKAEEGSARAGRRVSRNARRANPVPPARASGRVLAPAKVVPRSCYVPYAIHMESRRRISMKTKADLEPRQRVAETEKMTINLGVVDLGQIDLLVQEGFYSNRSDLVRTAVRNQIALHADALKQTVARRTLTLGLQHVSKLDLERAKAAGERVRIRVVGLARIADDVTPELARAAIESVSVLGAFHASPAVRRALADRTR